MFLAPCVCVTFLSLKVEECLPDSKDVNKLLGGSAVIRGVQITPQISFDIWKLVKIQQACGRVNWTDIGRQVLRKEKAGGDVQRLWQVWRWLCMLCLLLHSCHSESALEAPGYAHPSLRLKLLSCPLGAVLFCAK